MQPGHHAPGSNAFRGAIRDGLVLWACAGGLALAGGIAPMHCALLGWSLPYWLLLAPGMLLLVLDPGLPRRLLRRPRKRARAWTWS